MPPSQMRADRAEIADVIDRIPRPRPVDVLAPDGPIVYTMVLARPGVLHYPDGDEIVTEEVLADWGWLTQMAGIPLLYDDGTEHWATAQLDQRTRIGNIIRAWYDYELKLPLAEATVDQSRGIEAIRSGVTGVSVAYHRELASADGSVGSASTQDGLPKVQVRRHSPHNVTITTSPRSEGAGLRADANAEVDMDPEKIKALVDESVGELLTTHLAPLGEAIKLIGERIAKLEEAEEAELKADDDELKPAESPDVKGKEAVAEAKEEMRADALDALVTTARNHGVKMTGSVSDLRKAVAAKLGVATITGQELLVASRLASSAKSPYTATVIRADSTSATADTGVKTTMDLE